MSSVFDLILDMMVWVVDSLKQIPVSVGVNLFDFSFAILIMGIILSAIVISVRVSSLSSQSARYRDNRAAEREKRFAERRSAKKGS